MSINDRLRNEALSATLLKFTSTPRNRASPTVEDQVYDVAEYKRMETALDELRSCCRTDRALKSFRPFETQIRKKMRLEHPTILRERRQKSADESLIQQIQASRADIIASGLRPKIGWFGASVSDASSSTSGQPARLTVLDNSSTHAMFPCADKPARPTLAKSRTTGSLVGIGKPGHDTDSKSW